MILSASLPRQHEVLQKGIQGKGGANPLLIWPVGFLLHFWHQNSWNDRIACCCAIRRIQYLFVLQIFFGYLNHRVKTFCVFVNESCDPVSNSPSPLSPPPSLVCLCSGIEDVAVRRLCMCTLLMFAMYFFFLTGHPCRWRYGVLPASSLALLATNGFEPCIQT